MIKNLFAILKNIATPEAMAVLRNLSTDPRVNGFVRQQASEVLRPPVTTPDQKLIGGDSSEVGQLDDAQVHALREKLATRVGSARAPVQDWMDRIKRIDDQFEAAIQLYDAGKLNDSDILHLGSAVDEYYWRYRSYGKGGTEKVIQMIIKLVPSHPEVIPFLARATEEGWGYPAEEIAVMAMEHEIRDPILLEAFRVFVSSGIENRFEYRKVLEALGRLGSPENQRLVETLQLKATFRAVGREPEPTSYEAVIALGRLGVKDSSTVELLRSLMRENEAQYVGSGVPFAAALSFLGVRDEEVTGLLQRELTHSPNGFREHRQIAQEALACRTVLMTLGKSLSSSHLSGR